VISSGSRFLRDGGKFDDVGEKHRELFAVGSNLNASIAGEYRRIDLRGQVFGELRGQHLERLIFLRDKSMGLVGFLLGSEDLSFGALQLRDVGVHRDGPTVGRSCAH
jgi:hypothetical protein